MKRSLLALAVLGAFAGAASAQSSVTLSGIVDGGVRRVGAVVNGAVVNDYRFQGSTSTNNAFTIAGREDLGGGMSAFFSLNHRFAIGTGTVNSPTNNAGGADCNTNDAAATATGAPIANVPCVDPFWRNAWVGIGGNFGDVRLGRMLVPLQELNGGYDPFGVANVASTHTGGISATVRANNAIYYRTPSLGGLVVHAMVAAGDGQNQGVNGNGEYGSGTTGAQGYFVQANKIGAERPIGFAARYAAGPVDVSVAYDRNAAAMKTKAVYAAYNFGVVKLMGQFEKGDNFTKSAPSTNVAPAVTPGVAEDIKAYSLGLTAPVGAFLVKAGVLKIKSDLASRDASKFGFGGDYNLSKRTNLYSTVGKWSGNRISDANKKAQFDVGMVHRF